VSWTRRAAAVLRSAADHYRRQQQIAGRAVIAGRRAWRLLDVNDLDGSWPRVLRLLLPLTVAAQTASVTGSASYVPRALNEQDLTDEPAGEIVPDSLTGSASDGRPLDTLLYSPVTTVKSRIGGGAATQQAMTSGGLALDAILATQVADAGRIATGVGITARRNVGYIRMLNPPSCSRCAILAGKFYRWNAGFQRHINCDCVHVPTAENIAGDLTTDPMAAFRSGKITDLSRADTQAINDGADIGQVVNAHRGMVTAGGRKFTTEGMTKRGFAHQRLRSLGANRSVPRLTPEQIYRDAADRDAAIELLHRFGYIT
jgi:hypothetical protein